MSSDEEGYESESEGEEDLEDEDESEGEDGDSSDEEEDEGTVKEEIITSTKELDELLNVAEDSIAFAVKNFPKKGERDEVFGELKGYIDDLVQDFKASVQEAERSFNILIDIQMNKIGNLSKKVPILFNKTLDFSRSLGLKEFSAVCSKEKKEQDGVEKRRDDKFRICYMSEGQRDIQEKCKDKIDFDSFDEIGATWD